jgi:L-malate glycosyltransferase
MQRGTLQLINCARKEGHNHRLVVFDAPPTGEPSQYDPGDVPVDYISRQPGLDLKFSGLVTDYVSRHGIRILHTHNHSALFYGVLARRRIDAARVPRVLAAFHNLPERLTLKSRIATRWASRHADRIVAVSDELGRQLVRRGWIDRFITILNGLDLDAFGPGPTSGLWRSRLDIPERNVMVGHVGRFAPVKRQADLIDAMTVLGRHDPPVTLVLVGQGDDREAMIRRGGHAPCIRFVDRVTDMPSFLRELDIFVLCSEHEAMPRSLLEAMACGIPVIGTAVGGIPELLTGRGGLPEQLVPSGRPDILASRISALARDPLRRAALAKAGMARAREFSLEREWSRYRKLYAELSGAEVPFDPGSE